MFKWLYFRFPKAAERERKEVMLKKAWEREEKIQVRKTKFKTYFILISDRIVIIVGKKTLSLGKESDVIFVIFCRKRDAITWKRIRCISRSGRRRRGRFTQIWDPRLTFSAGRGHTIGNHIHVRPLSCYDKVSFSS